MVAIVIASLVALPTAQGAVRTLRVTTPVQEGKYASLTVNVAPRARCTATVTVKYANSVPRAEGLGTKTGKRITWRWPVGTNQQPGKRLVVVDCGKSGKLRTSITITSG